MERRNFLKGILASAAIPAFTKEEIQDVLAEDLQPQFVKAMISDTDSGTYPRRKGDKLWVYLIPESYYAITEEGGWISKRSITLL